MLAKCRGSECLTGAARFGYRVPANLCFLRLDIAQWVEHRPHTPRVAGSNPAIVN